MDLELTFSSDDACFHGHFPGNPVVPGSLVMALSLEHISAKTTKQLCVRSFSFVRFAPPGTYILRIAKDGPAWSCALCKDQDVYVRGRIETCA